MNGIFCPSVCPSVTPFSLCSRHRIIMKFSGVITHDQGKVHAKGQGHNPLNRFRTVTPVWIHKWWSNDAKSLMFRRGALLFFKVIHQISRSHGSKKSMNLTQIGHFRTLNPARIHQWLGNDAQSLKQQRRGALLFFKAIHQISRSHGSKNCRNWPKLGVSGL